jgi:hypothetical protein
LRTSGGDHIGGRAPGAGILGFVAAALVLDIFSAGRAVARALRHQHGKAARHQPACERAVFRLGHLRATQHVLRRGMRNHREPERSVARRAKQHGMRHGGEIGRRHQPLLHAVWLAFGALRAELRLRRRGLAADDPQRNQC